MLETIEKMNERLDTLIATQEQLLINVTALVAANKEMSEQLADMNTVLSRVGARYVWEEKLSQAGIQLMPGSTTARRTGTLVGVTAFPQPAPNGQVALSFAFVLKDDITGKFAILSPDLLSPI